MECAPVVSLSFLFCIISMYIIHTYAQETGKERNRSITEKKTF